MMGREDAGAGRPAPYRFRNAVERKAIFEGHHAQRPAMTARSKDAHW